MTKIPRSVGIHDGTFHADEITACALLLLYDFIDKDKITRTRDAHKLASCDYVCDVGGIYDPSRHLFDHHQVDYQGPLSSAGMILQYLKDQNHIDERLYRYFNDSLVIGVDAHDNGKVTPVKGYCTFSNVITNFTPIENDSSHENQNLAFHKALDFVVKYLRNVQKRFRYHQRCKSIVAACMEKDDTCLFFDKNIAWQESFFELNGVDHPAKFVIMPAGEHWKLRCIPPSYEDRMSVRYPLPKEWAGLLEDELRDISGIPGAVFCHKGRFISVWKHKEDAMKALQYVLEKEKMEQTS